MAVLTPNPPKPTGNLGSNELSESTKLRAHLNSLIGNLANAKSFSAIHSAAADLSGVLGNQRNHGQIPADSIHAIFRTDNAVKPENELLLRLATATLRQVDPSLLNDISARRPDGSKFDFVGIIGRELDVVANDNDPGRLAAFKASAPARFIDTCLALTLTGNPKGLEVLRNVVTTPPKDAKAMDLVGRARSTIQHLSDRGFK